MIVKDYFNHYIHLEGGYTYYLQSFLTEQGLATDNGSNHNHNLGKELQISRLQDIITTNMKTYNSDFELKNAYSEISIGADYTTKLIFMTKSILKMFREKIELNYGDRFKFRIDTASAY